MKIGQLVGYGLDSDGHTRVTKGGNFYLRGGTKETHEQMQEIAIKFNEKLGKKSIEEVSTKEAVEILREVAE
jgi:hypothetical protein